MSGKRRIARAVPLLAAVLLSAGCFGSGGDKSGGAAAPQVLILASNDGVDLSGVPAVARFVDRLNQLSSGRLTARVMPAWRGGGNEARVIQDVASGRADLGWSGTRAFDIVGVTSFQPLHAPFLVSSYAAQAAVVKDPVARDMLGGMRPLGLTGLALAADELRIPAGAAKPLLSPGDFDNLRFGTVASKIQSDGLRALGADAQSMAVQAPPETDGLDGLETMWWTYQVKAQYGFVPFVTGNAALWPRTVAIFANTKRFGQLDAAARGWVEQAAADASAWSAVHAGDAETDQIKQVCEFGTRIATATPAQLAALRAAAGPVYAVLRSDPLLGRTLFRVEAAVRSAGRGVSAPVPAGCAYHPGDEKRIPPPVRALPAPGRTGDLPQGSYRYASTERELMARGHTADDAHINAGVFTWTLRGGRWNSVQEPVDSTVQHTTCEGWYDVRDDAVTFTTITKYQGGTCAPDTWSARWSIHDRFLTWTAVSGADFADVWAGKPWQRIA
jgi:TRAP-type transport system periplasmic protein